MSAATREEVERYTEGGCHVFAVALHRMTGCPILVVTDPESPTWVDDEDADNQVDGVVHVFALIDGMAVDVEGSRPESEAEAYCEERFEPFAVSSETVAREAHLDTWLQGSFEDDDELGIERPLTAYTDGDVREAEELVERLGLATRPAHAP